MKKVSIKDIAEHLKISVPTVSLVLNGRGDEKRISKDTQQRIIKYAKEIQYRPNAFAKGLKKGRSEMIGLIIPDISDAFYARIARRIEKEAAKHHYTVIYSSSEESQEREEELIRSMLDRQVDGLIIASTQKNKKQIESLKKMNFPFVLIDRHYPEVETDYVIVDNKEGIAKAVRHMSNSGASNIGFVSITPELEAIKERLAGYKETIKEVGLPLSSSNIKELNRQTYEAQMSSVFDDFSTLSNPLDGIIFATHYLATAGLREMKKRGILLPQEMKMISYDQFSAFDLLEPSITVVKQPIEEIGDSAVDILLNKLKSRDTEIIQKVLQTGFIPRESCGESIRNS